MIHKFGVATLLVLALTLIFWNARRYLHEFLAPDVYSTVDSLFAALLVVLGAIAAYKDTVELLQIISKSGRETSETRSKPLGMLRSDLIAKVRSMWLHGLLYETVPPGAALELRTLQKPELVIRPPLMDLYDARTTNPVTASSLCDSIGWIIGGSFLILGAAGSGKTTLMLQLVDRLLRLADSDDASPLPLVFNLSSWHSGPSSFEEWLIREMSANYRIDRTTGEFLLQTQTLHLFLDGLDQVVKARRSRCVEAINRFMDSYGQTRVTISSRTTDYVQMDTKLRLTGAIEIQPLHDMEVEKFLQRCGKASASAKMMIESNESLSSLVRTPLFLVLVTRTYESIPGDELELDGYVPDQESVYRNYTAHMLQLHARGAGYSLDKALHWLTHLARFVRNAQQQDLLEMCLACLRCEESSEPEPIYLNPKQLRARMLPEKESYRVFSFVTLAAGLTQALIIGAFAGLCGVAFAVLQAESLHPFRPSLLAPDSLSGFLAGVISCILGYVGGGTLWRSFEECELEDMVLGELFLLLQRLVAGVFSGLFLTLYAWILGFDYVELAHVLLGSALGSLVVWLLRWMWFLLPEGLGLFVSGAKALASRLRIPLPKASFPAISLPAIPFAEDVSREACSVADKPPISQRRIELLFEGPIVRLYATCKGYLPRQLEQFLEDMTHAMVLRRREMGYEFIHETLVDYYAELQVEES